MLFHYCYFHTSIAISFIFLFFSLPANSDISVVCGTEYMDLSIFLCPVYQALYNESLLVLNNQLTRPQCFGTADWSVTPPVVKFRIPINETSISSCSNNFQVFYTIVGSGAFADFSNVQFVNISGAVNTIDPSVGMITYRPQVLYKFSCRYPMHYLINNTQMAVSGVNIAIKDNNGSFISTLSMQLYQDALYQQTLNVPQTGLNLKTKIYVLVKATNLTEKFNILLDRCYATTTPQPLVKSYYDLFVGCTRDPQTKVEINGVSRMAQFSFEAFRFVEHKNLSVSTFYIHCVTRLCEVSTCGSLLPVWHLRIIVVLWWLSSSALSSSLFSSSPWAVILCCTSDGENQLCSNIPTGREVPIY
uniref:Zona pellucida-like domain-containing protein 1 n=1 Tax=Mastacembelus armatus TaxID=205130 RepID=A0A3Q3MIT2_9TELE